VSQIARLWRHSWTKSFDENRVYLYDPTIKVRPRAQQQQWSYSQRWRRRSSTRCNSKRTVVESVQSTRTRKRQFCKDHGNPSTSARGRASERDEAETSHDETRECQIREFIHANLFSIAACVNMKKLEMLCLEDSIWRTSAIASSPSIRCSRQHVDASFAL